MCDFSVKLIAWLDHELPEDETIAVQRHLKTCTECRNQLEASKKVSTALDAYCDAVMEASDRHPAPHWPPVVAGAAAVMAVLLLALPRARVESPSLRAPVIAASPVVALKASAAPIHKGHHRHTVAPIRNPAANLSASVSASGPSIEIAIPAEAMFPPGALPEGISFIAELRISADGSAQQLRLRP